MPHLYDYAAQPQKTQARLREVMTLLYQPEWRGLQQDLFRPFTNLPGEVS